MIDELAAANKRIGELIERLTEVKVERELLKAENAQIEELRPAIEVLEKKAVSDRERIEELFDKLNDFPGCMGCEERDQLKAENERLVFQRDQAQKHCTMVEKERDQLRARVAELEDTVTSLSWSHKTELDHQRKHAEAWKLAAKLAEPLMGACSWSRVDMEKAEAALEAARNLDQEGG